MLSRPMKTVVRLSLLVSTACLFQVQSQTLPHSELLPPKLSPHFSKRQLRSTTVKTGTILMRLAQPVVMTPKKPLVVSFPLLPPDPNHTNLYSLWHSYDLVVWSMIRSNMVWPQATNSDVVVSNMVAREYWQIRLQPAANRIKAPSSARWDLDPNAKTE